MRLLLVTQDASLGVTLAFEDPERELVVAGSVSQAREHELRDFDACVIDIGSTSRGERAAQMFRDLGLGSSIVIGEDRARPQTERRRYLARPFSLPELESALRRVVPQRLGRGPSRRTRLIGRLFETWTTGHVPPGPEVGSDPLGRHEPTPASDPAAAVRSLSRRSVDDVRRSAGHEGSVAERIREGLEGTFLIERLVEEQPVLADVDAVATPALRIFSDTLLTSHIAIWVQVRDGSHVRVPYGSGGGPGRVSSRSPLFASLASSFDAVLVDRFPHPWFDGLTGDVPQEERLSAIAGALRTGSGYHGSVVAVGHGFSAGDRDALADLAWEVAPELALAAALERLGVGGRLFAIPEITETGRR